MRTYAHPRQGPLLKPQSGNSSQARAALLESKIATYENAACHGRRGKAGKQQKRKKLRLCSIQNLSALENVLRTGAMAMLCTTETQIEEIWKKEKPEAQAEAKGNIEKQHPKKSIQYNNAVV